MTIRELTLLRQRVKECGATYEQGLCRFCRCPSSPLKPGGHLCDRCVWFELDWAYADRDVLLLEVEKLQADERFLSARMKRLEEEESYLVRRVNSLEAELVSLMGEP